MSFLRVQSGHGHLYSMKADGLHKQLRMEFVCSSIKLSASGLLQF